MRRDVGPCHHALAPAKLLEGWGIAAAICLGPRMFSWVTAAETGEEKAHQIAREYETENPKFGIPKLFLKLS